MRHVAQLSPRRFDALLGVFGALAMLLFAALTGERTAPAWLMAVAVLSGAAVAFWRTAPIVTFAVAQVGVGLFVMLHSTNGPVWIGAFVGVFVLVRSVPRRRHWPLVLGGLVWLEVAANIGDDNVIQGIVFGLLMLGAVWMFGEIVALRGAREAEIARSHRAEAERRIAEERVRIARDLHDAVGHSLAAITLRAGVADHLLDRDTQEVRAAIRGIRGLAKDSLGELGAIVGVLRGSDGDTPAPRTPAPGLGRLEALVGTVRDAGLDAQLHGAPVDGVPEVVGVAGYRIVQEALTNVARHAGDGARATVSVARDEESLRIEVADDGRGANGTELVAGNGVIGMRERAAAVGGTLDAGPRPGGGWAVRVDLPV